MDDHRCQPPRIVSVAQAYCRCRDYSPETSTRRFAAFVPTIGEGSQHGSAVDPARVVDLGLRASIDSYEPLPDARLINLSSLLTFTPDMQDAAPAFVPTTGL